jgi:hypothetical protein
MRMCPVRAQVIGVCTTLEPHARHPGPPLPRFLVNAYHVQMRDAVPAAVVSGLRLKDENCFGVDVAQLISDDECEAVGARFFLLDGITEVIEQRRQQGVDLPFFRRR